jgi:hypothetical protein
MVAERRPVPERTQAQYRSNLEAFVLRARRVERHSLAADRDALVKLMRGEIQVIAHANGEADFRQDLPPEEVVESAAARVRPLLLEREDCFYGKALTALQYFCRDLPNEVQWAKGFGRAWRDRVGEGPKETGYRVMVTDTTTGQSSELNDRQLALAWIYGDVVHHDRERREVADQLGVLERYRGAVSLVAFTMVHSIALLNKLRILQREGGIRLRPEVFEEPVVVESRVWERRGRLFQAPVGTPSPCDAVTPFPDGWAPLVGSPLEADAE